MANPHLEAVWAKLLYLVPSPLYERSEPYYIAGVQLAETKQTNEAFAPKKTEIIIARGNEGNFLIDENSFEWVDYPLESAIESTDDRQRYMRDMEDFLKGCVKAEHVYAYDCVVGLTKLWYRPWLLTFKTSGSSETTESLCRPTIAVKSNALFILLILVLESYDSLKTCTEDFY